MRILIDADGCPVVRQVVDCAARRGVPVTLVCDTAHFFDIPDVEVIVVDKGADSADYRLVNRVSAGDIVITQDYGLAAMALARRARAMNQNGQKYTEDNIDAMLLARHTAARLRRGGVRLKGPAKRTAEQDAAFVAALLEEIDANP